MHTVQVDISMGVNNCIYKYYLRTIQSQDYLTMLHYWWNQYLVIGNQFMKEKDVYANFDDFELINHMWYRNER